MGTDGLLRALTLSKQARTGRYSSWDKSGRNSDCWQIEPGESRVLADIDGPGCITHIWMTQGKGYRDCVLRIYWDGEKNPSVNCPLGDFFGLGHELVNSYQSTLFSAATNTENEFNKGCALNCYAQMPFRRNARIELYNEGSSRHQQYFYIDHEAYDFELDDEVVYFHAQFKRQCPTPGWGPEIYVNTKESDIANKGRLAWDNNYVILEAEGKGHYIGCNMSVVDPQDQWWGEGDDMIWIDGYSWPPDIHGTGSEDYFNQAWGIQPTAFQRNGCSIFRHNKKTPGYWTMYVHHLENPVRFRSSIKATIEHGHGNHLGLDMCSVAYWYQAEPHKPFSIPPVSKRKPLLFRNDGKLMVDRKRLSKIKPMPLNREMKRKKAEWKKNHPKRSRSFWE